MRLPPLIPGTWIRRYRRFLVDVALEGGEVVTAHCPNTGSMRSCSDPGSRVYLSRHAHAHRRLPYTLELVEVGRTLVGVHTGRTHTLVVEAWEAGRIPELAGYTTLRREVSVAEGRLDLRLDGPEGTCFVEIKNVTLVEDGVAAFPDAVTQRGTRHLHLLMRLREQGARSVIFFVVQREDARTFSPADHLEPLYGKTLREVHQAGVEILVYQARVGPREIQLDRPLPWSLE